MVRRAVRDDLPRILDIYAIARQRMRDGGNTVQWRPGDAPEDKLSHDIAVGQLYAVTDDGGAIHGVFACVTGDDPTYACIEDGAWRSASPYAALHRMGGDGSGGVFRQGMDWAKAHHDHLRADTHASNAVMQMLLTRSGFAYCGVIYEPDGTPRLAYEWEKPTR